MKYFLTIISFILLVSCSSEKINQDLNKTFVKSYKELSGDCLESMIEILKPIKLEDENTKISHIYVLEVQLDPKLYSSDDLQFNYFIGIQLIPDSFEFIVLDIDLNLGAIANCQILDDESLIINNMNLLFTDLSNLGENNCFGIDKSLVEHTKGNKNKFRQTAWTNRIYGVWRPELETDEKFSNSLFNNLWVFKPEKGFLLLGSHNDTLLVDSIALQGESLILLNSGDTFDILTQTKTKIIIKEPVTNNFITLKRQSD